MENIENNLFKAVLISMLSLGVIAVIPAKNDEKPIRQSVLIAQSQQVIPQQVIPQVIIVGKRLPKHDILLAGR